MSPKFNVVLPVSKVILRPIILKRASQMLYNKKAESVYLYSDTSYTEATPLPSNVQPVLKGEDLDRYLKSISPIVNEVIGIDEPYNLLLSSHPLCEKTITNVILHQGACVSINDTNIVYADFFRDTILSTTPTLLKSIGTTNYFKLLKDTHLNGELQFKVGKGGDSKSAVVIFEECLDQQLTEDSMTITDFLANLSTIGNECITCTTPATTLTNTYYIRAELEVLDYRNKSSAALFKATVKVLPNEGVNGDTGCTNVSRYYLEGGFCFDADVRMLMDTTIARPWLDKTPSDPEYSSLVLQTPVEKSKCDNTAGSVNSF